jgi:hypothetical protein
MPFKNKDQRKEYNRAYYLAHKNELLNKSHAYHDIHKEYLTKQWRSYYELHKGDKAETRRLYERKYPERISAKHKVEYAIHVGKILKQPCEICGAEYTQAHHDDYSKPMVVRWLCIKHHRQYHAKKDSDK